MVGAPVVLKDELHHQVKAARKEVRKNMPWEWIEGVSWVLSPEAPDCQVKAAAGRESNQVWRPSKGPSCSGCSMLSARQAC